MENPGWRNLMPRGLFAHFSNQAGTEVGNGPNALTVRMQLLRLIEIAKGISTVFALAVILVWVSHTVTFQHLAESIHNQYATVRGEPFIYDGKPLVIHPFYNRIIFPIVFTFLTNTLHNWTDVQIFLGLRFLSFLLCLTAIYVAVHRRSHSSANGALIACSVLALSMVPTFTHLWVHTSDIFDLTFSFFIFLYLAEGRLLPAFLVACLTAVNRETGAFAGVFYLCIAFGRQKTQSVVVRAITLTLVPYLGAVLVRKLVLGHELPLESSGQWYTGFNHNFAILLATLKQPSPIAWPGLLFAMLALPWLVFVSQKTAANFKFRVVLAFLAVFAITAAVGINAETRTFIPCVALLIACSVAIPESSDLVPSDSVVA